MNLLCSMIVSCIPDALTSLLTGMQVLRYNHNERYMSHYDYFHDEASTPVPPLSKVMSRLAKKSLHQFPPIW